MPRSWARALSARNSHHHYVGILSRIASLHAYCTKPCKGEAKVFPFSSGSSSQAKCGLSSCHFTRHDIETATLDSRCYELFPLAHPVAFTNVRKLCTVSTAETKDKWSDFGFSPDDTNSQVEFSGDSDSMTDAHEQKVVFSTAESVDFTKIAIGKLPTVLIVGRPNVGKSALFNRLIRRREALVYNTPADHVTRDIRDGVAKLGDLRFMVLDSAGLEAEATAGSVLQRTAEMTGNVLARSQFALFMIDAREGLQPMDIDVGKWLRKHASEIKIIVVMNKAEALAESDGSLAAAAGEAYRLGFGDPIAVSAETGFGMAELHETLRPLLQEYVLKNLNDDDNHEKGSSKGMEAKLPLQLAIVGRPNVGKSTLLNAILQEDRVLVGPEAGLTRDSIRAQFHYDGRTIYLVDTAGWLDRTKQKGPSSLSIVQSRKHLMRAHIVALVLDAEEVAKDRRSMKHVEVLIARRAVEEGRGLVVIVNKMDLLRGKQKSKLYQSVIRAVPEEIQTVIPQIERLII